jgi:HTH-type transcriptional regulator/antitoxin HigA
MTTIYDQKTYGSLLIEANPGPIETKKENERALAIIDRLMRKDEGALSPEEDRLLRMLAVLVEDFESRAYPMGPSNPAVALRELMREHDLKQSDMLDIFGSQGTVSQVLNGKREISKSQARKLSERFRLPIDVFI